MSLKCYICRVFKRSLLYQILIAFACFKLPFAWKMHRDFDKKVKALLNILGVVYNQKKYKKLDKEMLYKGFLITLIVLASLNILGVRFLSLFSGLGILLAAFIYHNPLPKIFENLQNRIPLDKEHFIEYLPEIDFLLYLSLSLAMIAITFKRCKCEKKEEAAGIEQTPNNKINEIKKQEKTDKNKKAVGKGDKTKKKKVE